jgi:hypothetical protein
MSAGYWIEWDIPDADTHVYSLGTLQDTGSNTLNPQIDPGQSGGTSTGMGSECSAGDGVGITGLHPNTLYWLTMQGTSSGGTNTIKMYNSSGTLVGTGTCTAGTNPFFLAGIGISGAESQASGDHIWIDDFVVDVNGNFPMLADFSKAPEIQAKIDRQRFENFFNAAGGK